MALDLSRNDCLSTLDLDCVSLTAERHIISFINGYLYTIFSILDSLPGPSLDELLVRLNGWTYWRESAEEWDALAHIIVRSPLAHFKELRITLIFYVTTEVLESDKELMAKLTELEQTIRRTIVAVHRTARVTCTVFLMKCRRSRRARCHRNIRQSIYIQTVWFIALIAVLRLTVCLVPCLM